MKNILNIIILILLSISLSNAYHYQLEKREFGYRRQFPQKCRCYERIEENHCMQCPSCYWDEIQCIAKSCTQLGSQEQCLKHQGCFWDQQCYQATSCSQFLERDSCNSQYQDLQCVFKNGQCETFSKCQDYQYDSNLKLFYLGCELSPEPYGIYTESGIFCEEYKTSEMCQRGSHESRQCLWTKGKCNEFYECSQAETDEQACIGTALTRQNCKFVANKCLPLECEDNKTESECNLFQFNNSIFCRWNSIDNTCTTLQNGLEDMNQQECVNNQYIWKVDGCQSCEQDIFSIQNRKNDGERRLYSSSVSVVQPCECGFYFDSYLCGRHPYCDWSMNVCKDNKKNCSSFPSKYSCPIEKMCYWSGTSCKTANTCAQFLTEQQCNSAPFGNNFCRFENKKCVEYPISKIQCSDMKSAILCNYSQKPLCYFNTLLLRCEEFTQCSRVNNNNNICYNRRERRCKDYQNSYECHYVLDPSRQQVTGCKWSNNQCQNKYNCPQPVSSICGNNSEIGVSSKVMPCNNQSNNTPAPSSPTPMPKPSTTPTPKPNPKPTPNSNPNPKPTPNSNPNPKPTPNSNPNPKPTPNSNPNSNSTDSTESDESNSIGIIGGSVGGAVGLLSIIGLISRFCF